MKKSLLFTVAVMASVMSVFAQNVFDANNANLYLNNCLKANNRLYLQFVSNTANASTRGILGQSIFWNTGTQQWNIGASGSTVADFSLVRFENAGNIGFFNRASVSDQPSYPYPMGNDELEAYRKMTILTNGNIGMGIKNPSEALSVASANAYALSLLKTVDGANLTSGSTGGALYLGSFDAALSVRRVGSWIRMLATEDWNAGTAQGTALVFGTASNGSTTISERLRIDNNGNVGIGTTSPSQKLLVNGNIQAIGKGYFQQVEASINTAGTTDQTAGYGGYTLTARKLAESSNEYKWSIYTAQPAGGYGVTPNGFDVWEYPQGNTENCCRQRFAIYPSEKNGVNSNITPFVVGPSGKVAIGYLNAADAVNGPYTLSVNGDIGAKKVKVTLDGWADYVFEKDYALMPLNKLEAFIKQNKHLPDVPSAQDVAKDGVDLGDTQAVLLKKIEELTLYLIEMMKENEETKKVSIEVKKENELLRKRVENLEKK